MENLPTLIETIYARQQEALTSYPGFAALEDGTAARADYDAFIGDLCRAHLKSPHILAFLFSAAPPESAVNLKHNLFEELGVDGAAHPDLLLVMAAAAGFDEAERRRLQTEAQEDLRRIATDPILFGTLRELAFSVLAETIAYEWMLARTASRMARFLARHRGLSDESLEWFHHHSEVDLRHAAEGIEAIVDFARYYELAPADVEIILDVTFRENVFIKRYFRHSAAASRAGAYAV